MRAFRTVLMAAAFGLASMAQASERLVVVELFTSQGCSSCPPADKILAELTTRSDILPLALHVDYWDYIGWKDTFASPAYTKRQRGYAAAAKSRSIYTPQLVVGGVDHVIGAKPMKLAERIEEHRRLSPEVDLDLVADGGTLRVKATAKSPQSGKYSVVLVHFTPEATVEIRRGENAGRTITYHNIVTSMEEIGRWDGRGSFQTTTPLKGDGQHAVLIQRDGHREILTAARP